MTDDEQRAETRRPVVVETRGACESIVIIRLNQPAERNPLSLATLEKLDRLVSTLSTRTDINAIIFTGTGEAFASGANIREVSAQTAATAGEFALRGQRLMQKIVDAPQLTIAAVNGYCMGGGLDLALACDLRCAAPAAVFAHPGARLGIITGWGGTQRLPQLIGSARAFEMFLTARLVSGAEALEIGLVNRLGENALDCALEISSNVQKKGDG
ncbi:MAG TPA: enoyl-CoA hydratase/isomerase family protein [Pyrinomonadaceae bacterium]|nr:enoyl-CoA hydratase/isomerase family protein [Pyrinomonadaceae bacterium]